MRSNCPPHYHLIKLPSGRVIRTKNDCHVSSDSKLHQSVALELGHFQDEELGGILDLGLGVADLFTGGLASKGAEAIGLTGGREAPRATTPATLGPQVQQAINAASASDVRSIVRELLSEVPPPVRDQMRSALQEYKLANVDNKATINDIVAKVAKEFQPKLLAAAQLLKEKQLQTIATNEHNVIVKDDHRWQGNTDNQEKIYNRILLMEKRVAKALQTRRNHNAKVSAAFGIPSSEVM